MSLGSQTAVVDGQRNIFPTVGQFNPTAYGARQVTGVPQVSPTMPPFIGASNGAGASLGYDGVGGYGTAGNNALTTQIAAEHPHNLKVSPVWWAVILLLFGVLALRGTAWRKTMLEADEGVRVGGAREEAKAES